MGRHIETDTRSQEEKDLAWLNNGWDFLEAYPTHPLSQALEEEWLRRLRMYEQAVSLIHYRDKPIPKHRDEEGT